MSFLSDRAVVFNAPVWDYAVTLGTLRDIPQFKAAKESAFGAEILKKNSQPVFTSGDTAIYSIAKPRATE